jgi:hypothetical protein
VIGLRTPRPNRPPLHWRPTTEWAAFHFVELPICNALTLVDIRVLDPLIVGDNCQSFALL